MAGNFIPVRRFHFSNFHVSRLRTNMSQIFPWDCRDKEDTAWALHDTPQRTAAAELAEENMELKKILRENGIAWSPIARAHLQRERGDRRVTRSAGTSRNPGLPTLPMEVILRILEYAITSDYPIIDPLWSNTKHNDKSFTTRVNLTKKEQERGNQIAIHFLATCKQLNVEGSRMMWKKNDFVFTTHLALRHFANLNRDYRITIDHITLRVIAKYYDDQKRQHQLDGIYHPDLNGKNQKLKYQIRPKESPLARGGFRCYAWNQVIDFLVALRPPYEPATVTSGKQKERARPRPRLLPSLTSIRFDLVNFSDTLLPFSGTELHDITTHEMGCTLNEIQITGMPIDDTGVKASAELSGLLKDDGLYLEAPATFLAQENYVRPLGDHFWSPKVIRSGCFPFSDSDDEDEDSDYQFEPHRTKIGLLPPAPLETGHPKARRSLDKVIWKKYPCRRDGDKRVWQLFNRMSGDLADPTKACDECGVVHEPRHPPLLDGADLM